MEPIWCGNGRRAVCQSKDALKVVNRNDSHRNRVVTQVTKSEQEKTNGVDSHTHFPY